MKKFSLLYVDDEESNLRIFKDTFRRKFEVYTAISAKEGMKILDEHRIDLVLSDQRMPEMTGVEFLKYTLEKFPEPNRILITGYTDINAIESAINHAHIFQYVQKPWDEAYLLKVIKTALSVYQLEVENKEQREELILAKEKAEESDRLKTEFINNISHEIRTPMNGIIGFSSFLSSPDLPEEDKNKYVSIIQNSGYQLMRIIDDILEISRLGTKQVPVIENKICLNSLFAEQFELFNTKALESQIPLYLKKGLSEEESTLFTDEVKLTKILGNILENAIKFTNDGYIEFGYKLVDDDIEIYVKDTGIGIHPDKHDLIFERFSQEEKEFSKKTGGLGLGLSIAKENVELLDGKITVKSKKGEGTTFFVKIPYKPAGLTDDHSDQKKDISTSQEEYIILIAEDEEVNYIYLEILIKKMLHTNCTLLHAKNGKEAIEIYKNNPDINFVLMDLKMPVMNGFDATKQLKKLRPDLPIIAQTAYSTVADKDRAISSGCDDFISKPINEEMLCSVMNKYL